MFLSQLILDRTDRNTMKVLADPYKTHKLVMSGFAAYSDLQRVLYRVEPAVRDHDIKILVQSHERPAWESSSYGCPLRGVQTKDFQLNVPMGASFRFRLRANPVVTRDGKRHGLIRDEALIEWLKKKEDRVGAIFQSVLPVDEGYVTGQRIMGDRLDKVQIKIARFEGRLAVRDPQLFSDAVAAGIGPAKSFGCGLLSLAKA